MWKLDGSKKPLNSRKERKKKKSKPLSKNKEIKVKSFNYIVKKGDTLYSISKKSNISIKELLKINNMSKNNISIGQVLKLK